MKTLLAMHLVVPDFPGGMASPEIETGLLAVIPSTSHGNRDWFTGRDTFYFSRK